MVAGLGGGLLAGSIAAVYFGRQMPPVVKGAAAGGNGGHLTSAADYEYCARVVWSDDPRRGKGNLEDTESIEAFTNGGWELVDVIVPFAQTKLLDISYPGNTRKLIAYFRRPRGGIENGSNAQ
jgi:hypothetical protein